MAAPEHKSILKDKRFWWVLGGVVLVAAVGTALSQEEELFGSAGAVIGIALLYFLPAVIARKKHNANSVFVINLFLGWTLIGWVVALAMAVSNPAPAQVAQNPGGLPQKRCPYCAEVILAAATVCKHCGREQPKN